MYKMIISPNNCIKLFTLTSSSGGKSNVTIKESFTKTFR